LTPVPDCLHFMNRAFLSMSINMNNRGNQAVAVLVVVILFVFAWDLGRKQALNTLLVGDAYLTDSEVPEGAYSSENSNQVNRRGANVADKILSILSTGESVKVEDQPAGTEIKVSSLSLSNMGWVGVRDADGRVLGAGRFEAGSFSDVTVPLLRATVAGESYQVLLYADDGNREFDLHKDILISGPNGGVAGTNFRAL